MLYFYGHGSFVELGSHEVSHVSDSFRHLVSS